MVALIITNPDGATGTTGWTNADGTYAVNTVTNPLYNLTPTAGGGTFFYGETTVLATQFQIIQLSPAQITQVTAGNSYVELHWQQGSYSGYDLGSMTLTPMDAANVELHSETTGQVRTPSVRNLGPWSDASLSTYLPPTTTQVKITMSTQRLSGSDSDGYITSLILNLFEEVPTGLLDVVLPDTTVVGSPKWNLSLGQKTLPNDVNISFDKAGTIIYGSTRPLPCGVYRMGTIPTVTTGVEIAIDYDNTTTPPATSYGDNYLDLKMSCFDATGVHLGVVASEPSRITVFGPPATARRFLNVPAGTVKVILYLNGYVVSDTSLGFWITDVAVSNFTPSVLNDPNQYEIQQGFSIKTYTKSYPAAPANFFGARDVNPLLENAAFAPANNVFVAASNFGTCQLECFTKDYFGNIYLIPLEHNFGDIQSDTSYTFTVWNAYLYSNASLQSLAFDTSNGQQSAVANGGGVTTPFYTFPTTMGPQQFSTYDVTALVTGPPVLKAKLDLTSSLATIDFPAQALNLVDLKSLLLSGNRGKVLPYNHNWSGDYVLEYIFKTEIIKSWGGQEQRRATNSVPRRSIAIDGLIANKDDHFINEFGQNAIIVPECTDYANFTLNVDGTLSTTEYKRWMLPNGIVFIGAGCCDPALISTTIVSAVTLLGTTTITVGAAIPQGGRIYPGMSGRINSHSSNFLTSTTATSSVTVDEAPGSWGYTPKPLPALLADGVEHGTGVFYPHGWRPTLYEVTTIDGLEIFDKEPNWASPVKSDYKPNRHDLDFQKGVIEYNSPERPSVTYKLTYLEKDASYFRDFFLRMKGRRSSFYFVTQLRDVEATIGAPGLDAITLSEDPGFNQLGQPYGISIKKDGKWHHFKIKSLTGVDLVVNTAFTVDLTNPQKVSWLYKARFDTDKLALHYKTTEVVEINLGMRIL